MKTTHIGSPHAERIHKINSYLWQMGIPKEKFIEVTVAFANTFDQKQRRVNRLPITHWFRFKRFVKNYQNEQS